MDRVKAKIAFKDYASEFDVQNSMNAHKIAHTYRVADLAEKIAERINADLADFAWLLGLLHDIGRFEQVRRYGNLVDAQTVDHAELGADILFQQGLIERFPTDTLPENWRGIAETAIRLHNKLALPDDLDLQARMMTQILRDADKLDIFRVLTEWPLAERMGNSKEQFSVSDEISPAVMGYVLQHRCVPRKDRCTVLDERVSHCCMAFDLIYPVSRKIAIEQGYLLRLLEERDVDGHRSGNEKQLQQLAIVRQEIEKAWGMPLVGDC